MSASNKSREIRVALSERRLHDAKTSFTQGLAEYDEILLSEIRKQGSFRSSKNEFHIEATTKLISWILDSKRSQLSQAWIRYLKSIKSLLHISASARKVYITMLKEIRSQPSRLKELLASVEIYWLERWLNGGMKDDFGTETTLHFPEEIAECFSFYAYHAVSSKPLKDVNLNLFNEENVTSGHSFEYLAKLRPIIEIQKAEILIDHFGYIADRDKNQINLRAPSDDFERAVRFGFATAEIAEQNLSLEVIRDFPKTISLKEEAERLFQNVGDRLVQLAKNPDRLVINLPDIPHLRDILFNPAYYQEEIYSVARAMKEFHIDYESFHRKPVFKDVTLGDVLKFQRLFYFIMTGFSSYVKKHASINPIILIRSLIPVMTTNQLLEFGGPYLDRSKIENISELLSWTTERGGVFDVQYQPVIKSDNYYMLPYNLISQSNLLRNVLLVSKFRFDANSDTDPVTEALAKTLLNQGFLVATNRRYSHKGLNGEIDVIAMRDGYIFAFECKSSIHPAGVAELRTSFDYMEKGSTQLSRFQQVIQDSEFMRVFLKSLKWEMVDAEHVVTCIVMGNRMFSGLSYLSHPVRPLFSILAFIEKGEISYSDRVERLWLGDNFTAEDLRRYIVDNIVHGQLIDLMVPHTFSYAIAGKRLNVKTFALDLSSLIPKGQG